MAESTPKAAGLPLAGLRVVEFGGLAPGPLVGMVLADFGADVVRIDKVGATLNPDSLCRGKRSLAISPKDPEGNKALQQLIGKADVLIDPFRPGVLERLGLGPEEMCNENPRLVYARITGFQREGPYASMAGHDINYIALSGVLSMLGAGPNAPPQPPINILGDFAGGSLVCLLGVLVALVERGVSGKGQVVEADMVTGARYISTFVLLAAALEHPTWGSPVSDGTNAKRGTGMLDGGAPWYGVYRTSDGEWMSVGAIEPQFYAELLKILAEQVPSKPSPSRKTQHDRGTWPQLRAYLQECFGTKTREEWSRVFVGTDACCVPVLTPQEAAVQAVEPRLPAAEPEEGSSSASPVAAGIVVPHPAPRLRRTPARAPGGSATFTPRDDDPGAELLLTPGEHSADVLTAWCGLPTDEVAALWRRGAVGGPDPPGGVEPKSKL